jgi:hypothetical protein
MAGDDLTIVLFFGTLAVTFFVTGATIAGWKHRLLITAMFVFAVGSLAIGAGWLWLKPLSPTVARIILQVTTNPISWFVTFLFSIALVTLSARPKLDVSFRSERRIWAALAIGLILFLVAISVYPTKEPDRAVAPIDNIEKRLLSLENKSLGQATGPDPRIDEVIQRLSVLAAMPSC